MNFNEISNYFTNPLFIDASIDIFIKKFLLQFEGTFGLSKTKNELLFLEGSVWEKDKFVLSGHYTCNIGFSIIDNRFILITPNVGIGIKTMTSNLLFGKDISSNEPLLSYYKVGIFTNLKPIILSSHMRINNKDINYSCLRLGIHFEGIIGKPKYSEYYNGNMLFFTLGIGSLSRSYNSKYDTKKMIVY